MFSTFNLVRKFLRCNHSIKNSSAPLSYCAVYILHLTRFFVDLLAITLRYLIHSNRINSPRRIIIASSRKM